MNTKMRKYKVIVEHDNGVITLLVWATSIVQAKEQVKAAEGCPDSAILAVLKSR